MREIGPERRIPYAVKQKGLAMLRDMSHEQKRIWKHRFCRNGLLRRATLPEDGIIWDRMHAGNGGAKIFL